MSAAKTRKYIPKLIRDTCFEIDGYTCVYCACSPMFESRKLRIGLDHIIPVSHSGCDNISNLITCCQRCNASLQDTPAEIKLKSLMWITSKRRKLILRWQNIRPEYVTSRVHHTYKMAYVRARIEKIRIMKLRNVAIQMRQNWDQRREEKRRYLLP